MPIAPIYLDSRSTILHLRENLEHTMEVYALLVSYDLSDPPELTPEGRKATLTYVWTALALERVEGTDNVFGRVGLLICTNRELLHCRASLVR